MEKEGNYAAIQTMDNYDITGLFLGGNQETTIFGDIDIIFAIL
jgi:hypothetical protein